MRKNIIFILLLSFLLYSCTNEYTKDIPDINISGKNWSFKTSKDWIQIQWENWNIWIWNTK